MWFRLGIVILVIVNVVPGSSVEGVYRLPWRFSDRLDEREELPNNGYRHEFIEVYRGKNDIQCAHLRCR